MTESEVNQLIERCREIWKSKPRSRKEIESLVAQLKSGTISIASAKRIVFLLLTFDAELARLTIKV